VNLDIRIAERDERINVTRIERLGEAALELDVLLGHVASSLIRGALTGQEAGWASLRAKSRTLFVAFFGDTGSTMSGENIELLRAALEDYNEARGLEAFFALLADDIVWDLSRSPFPEAGVYQGVDAVRSWFRGLRDAFGEVRYEVEKQRELNEQVVQLVRITGRGPGSQIPVDYSFAPVYTFRDRKIARMDRYDDWAAAMEAVSLPPTSA
jgi:ketosteroid isomerase-like protein